MIQFTIACTSGHKQTFQTSDFLIGPYAKEIASLADGSSTELSGDKVLGKCSVCGAPVACTASIPLEGQRS